MAAADDLAEIGVEVKVIEVKPGGGGAHPHRKVVDAGGLTVKLHAVMHRVLPVFGQHQVGVHIAKAFGGGQVKDHLGIGRHGAKRRFVRRVGAVIEGMLHLLRLHCKKGRRAPRGERPRAAPQRPVQLTGSR